MPNKELKELREDKQTFEHIIDNYTSPLIGFGGGKDVISGKTLVSKAISKSDEAFLHLCLENYEQYCKDKVNGVLQNVVPNSAGNNPEGNNRRSKKVLTGRWTKNGAEAARTGGWNDEGLKRYKELLEWVLHDRAKNGKVEEEYKEQKKRDDPNEKRKAEKQRSDEQRKRSRTECGFDNGDLKDYVDAKYLDGLI